MNTNTRVSELGYLGIRLGLFLLPVLVSGGIKAEPGGAQTREDSLQVLSTVMESIVADSSIFLVQGTFDLVRSAAGMLPSGSIRFLPGRYCEEGVGYLISVKMMGTRTRELVIPDMVLPQSDTVSLTVRGFELSSDKARVPVDFGSCGGEPVSWHREGGSLPSYTHGRAYDLERLDGKWVVTGAGLRWVH